MIVSLSNDKVKAALKLQTKKYRDLSSTFLVEGFHLLEEARSQGLLVEVFTSNPKVAGTLVSRDIIKRLATTETPQEVVGVVKKPLVQKLGSKVLVLENVQDPGNVGTLIRTAKSFGFDSVLVQGADVYSSKVLRASQGAIFSINVLNVKDVLEYVQGFKLIGAVLDKEAQPYDQVKLPSKFMLVLGNEGNGLSKQFQAMLDVKVYIPIQFESLNVAVAGGILMHEYSK